MLSEVGKGKVVQANTLDEEHMRWRCIENVIKKSSHVGASLAVALRSFPEKTALTEKAVEVIASFIFFYYVTTRSSCAMLLEGGQREQVLCCFP